MSLKRAVVYAKAFLIVFAIISLISIVANVALMVQEQFLQLFSYSYSFNYSNLDDVNTEEEVVNQDALYNTFYNVVSETSYYQAFNTQYSYQAQKPANWFLRAFCGIETQGEANSVTADINKLFSTVRNILGFETMDPRALVHDANMRTIETMKKAVSFTSIEGYKDANEASTYFRDYYNRENDFVLAPGLLKELNNKILNRPNMSEKVDRVLYPEAFTKPVQFVRDYNRVRPVDDEENPEAKEDYVYVTQRVLYEDFAKTHVKVTDALIDGYSNPKYQQVYATWDQLFSDSKYNHEGEILTLPAPYIYEPIVLKRNTREGLQDLKDSEYEGIALNNVSSYATIANEDNKSMEIPRLYWKIVKTDTTTATTLVNNQTSIGTYYWPNEVKDDGGITYNSKPDDKSGTTLIGPYASYSDMINNIKIGQGAGGARPLEGPEYNNAQIYWEMSSVINTDNASSSNGDTQSGKPDDLIEVNSSSLPGVTVDLLYCKPYKGGPALYPAGYKTYLRESTIEKLKKAQSSLPSGYSLYIWDGYRTDEVQEKLRQFSSNGGYVSQGISRHQRGSTVDVTIIDKNGNLLDMGSVLDEFDTPANRDYSGLNAQQKANRKILDNAMIGAGFSTIPSEWWHFDDKSQDYPAVLDFDPVTGQNTGTATNPPASNTPTNPPASTKDEPTFVITYTQKIMNKKKIDNSAENEPKYEYTYEDKAGKITAPVNATFPELHYQLAPLTDGEELTATGRVYVNLSEFNIPVVRDTYRRTAEYTTRLESFLQANSANYEQISKDDAKWYENFANSVGAFFTNITGGTATVDIDLDVMAQAVYDFEYGEIIPNGQCGFQWEYAQNLSDYSSTGMSNELYQKVSDRLYLNYRYNFSKVLQNYTDSFTAGDIAVKSAIDSYSKFDVSNSSMIGAKTNAFLAFFGADNTDSLLAEMRVNNKYLSSAYIPTSLSASYKFNGSFGDSDGDGIVEMGIAEENILGKDIRGNTRVGETQLVSTLSDGQGRALIGYFTGIDIGESSGTLNELGNRFIKVIEDGSDSLERKDSSTINSKQVITDGDESGMNKYEFRNTDVVLDVSSKRFRYADGTILPFEVRSVRDYGLASILEYSEGLSVVFKRGTYYDQPYTSDGVSAFLNATGTYTPDGFDASGNNKYNADDTKAGFYPSQFMNVKINNGETDLGFHDDFIQGQGTTDAFFNGSDEANILAPDQIVNGKQSIVHTEDGQGLDIDVSTSKDSTSFEVNKPGGTGTVSIKTFVPYKPTNGQGNTYNDPKKYYINWFERQTEDIGDKIIDFLKSVVTFGKSSDVVTEDGTVAAINSAFESGTLDNLDKNTKARFQSGLSDKDLGPYEFYSDNLDILKSKYSASIGPFKYMEDNAAEHMYLISSALTFLGRFDFTYEDVMEEQGAISDYDSTRLIGLYYNDRSYYIDKWEAKQVGWHYLEKSGLILSGCGLEPRNVEENCTNDSGINSYAEDVPEFSTITAKADILDENPTGSHECSGHPTYDEEGNQTGTNYDTITEGTVYYRVGVEKPYILSSQYESPNIKIYSRIGTENISGYRGTEKLNELLKDQPSFKLKDGSANAYESDVDLSKNISVGDPEFSLEKNTATSTTTIGSTDWSDVGGGGIALKPGGNSKDMRDKGQAQPLYRVYAGSIYRIYPKEMGTYFEGEVLAAWKARLTMGKDDDPNDTEKQNRISKEKQSKMAYFESYLTDFETYMPTNLTNDADVKERIGMVNAYVNPTAQMNAKTTAEIAALFTQETAKDYWKKTYENMKNVWKTFVGGAGVPESQMPAAFGGILQGLMEKENELAEKALFNYICAKYPDVDTSDSNNLKIVSELLAQSRKYSEASKIKELFDSAPGKLGTKWVLKCTGGTTRTIKYEDCNVLGWGYLEATNGKLDSSSLLNASGAWSNGSLGNVSLTINSNLDERLNAKKVIEYEGNKFVRLLNKYEDVNTAIYAYLVGEPITDKLIVIAERDNKNSATGQGSKITVFNPTSEQIDEALSGLTPEQQAKVDKTKLSSGCIEEVLGYIKNVGARKELSNTTTINTVPGDGGKQAEAVLKAAQAIEPSNGEGKTWLQVTQEECAAFGKPEYVNIILAMAYTESTFNNNSHGGASWGALQIDPRDDFPQADCQNYRKAVKWTLENIFSDSKVEDAKRLYAQYGVSAPSDNDVLLYMICSHNKGAFGVEMQLKTAQEMYGDASLWWSKSGTDKEFYIKWLDKVSDKPQSIANAKKGAMEWTGEWTSSNFGDADTKTGIFKYGYYGDPWYAQKVALRAQIDVTLTGNAPSGYQNSALNNEFRNMMLKDQRLMTGTSVFLISSPQTLSDVRIMYKQATLYKNSPGAITPNTGNTTQTGTTVTQPDAGGSTTAPDGSGTNGGTSTTTPPTTSPATTTPPGTDASTSPPEADGSVTDDTTDTSNKSSGSLDIVNATRDQVFVTDWDFDILSLLGNEFGEGVGASSRVAKEGEHPGEPSGIFGNNINAGMSLGTYTSTNNPPSQYIKEMGHFGDHGGMITYTDPDAHGPVANGPIYFYSQLDPAWTGLNYAAIGSGTIKSSACGPSSAAIAISTVLQTVVNPPETVVMALNKNQRVQDAGSSHDLFNQLAKSASEWIQETRVRPDIADIKRYLDAGWVMIMSGSTNSRATSPFTPGGHFITVVGYKDVPGDTILLVADPAEHQGKHYGQEGIQGYSWLRVIKRDLGGYCGAIGRAEWPKP